MNRLADRPWAIISLAVGMIRALLAATDPVYSDRYAAGRRGHAARHSSAGSRVLDRPRRYEAGRTVVKRQLGVPTSKQFVRASGREPWGVECVFSIGGG